ncbi:MAG: glycoside hydrolase family 2 TIM barrel-domain containing protein, partial [Chitinophagaceae bacterium]
MQKKLSVFGQINSIQKPDDAGLKGNGSAHNIQVRGKFIVVNNDKFIIKGVTYGTFRPDENGIQYPGSDIIEKDFSLMNLHGINTVRTYTVPPVHLLNIALQKGIKVMVGLPWEQHITFLDSRERQHVIIDSVKKAIIECANHPAILCYTIGNEIPASIVRWYGAKAIEKFLHQLYKTVKVIDSRALVTYVNYPTTEFLHLPFLDFHCFNVYLETKDKLERYLQRLHNLAGDTPLVLA